MRDRSVHNKQTNNNKNVRDKHGGGYNNVVVVAKKTVTKRDMREPTVPIPPTHPVPCTHTHTHTSTNCNGGCNTPIGYREGLHAHLVKPALFGSHPAGGS
jgi:plastocyanin domain-containing protein